MSIGLEDQHNRLVVTSYSEKGYGCFGKQEILGSVLGDEVQVVPLKKKKGKILCKVEKILTPSKDRIPTRCKHANLCGGCVWQQINYQAQLQEKETFIEKLFSMKPDSILHADNPWNYRNKMEFSFSPHRLGLIVAGSKGHVIDIGECHITNPSFSQVLEKVRTWWKDLNLLAYRPHKDEGSLITLTLREGKNTGDFMAILTVSGNPLYGLRKSHIEAFRKAITHVYPSSSIFLRIKQTAKGSPTQFFEMHLAGPEHVREKIGNLIFYLSPTAFFQPNTEMAEKMYTKALEMLDLTGNERIADLYCGVGSIGMFFSSKCKEVTGIEINPYAVYDGQFSIQKNGIKNMKLTVGDVGEASLKDIDVVIVDPPRAGLGKKAIQQVLSLNPKKILYFSCNPKTQAEDIRVLGYMIKKIQPIDQFPHTPHVENLVLLEK